MGTLTNGEKFRIFADREFMECELELMEWVQREIYGIFGKSLHRQTLRF